MTDTLLMKGQSNNAKVLTVMIVVSYLVLGWCYVCQAQDDGLNIIDVHANFSGPRIHRAKTAEMAAAKG
jgi:hypothetical protein